MSDGDRAAGRSPRALAPLFVATALVHFGALMTRFGTVADELPEGFAAALLWAHFPLFLVEGFFEGMLDYGPERASMPLWMRITCMWFQW